MGVALDTVAVDTVAVGGGTVAVATGAADTTTVADDETEVRPGCECVTECTETCLDCLMCIAEGGDFSSCVCRLTFLDLDCTSCVDDCLDCFPFAPDTPDLPFTV